MKRLATLIACIISVGFMTSCEKEEENNPVPAFKILAKYAHINEEVSFQNLSQDATSYEWDFADGTISTEENPTHVFTETGHYIVKLYAITNTMKSYAVSAIDVFPSEGAYEGITSQNKDIWFSISENRVTDFKTYIRGSYGSSSYSTNNYGEMSFVNDSIQAFNYPNDTMTFIFKNSVIRGMLVFGDYDLDSEGNIIDKRISFQAQFVEGE